MILGATYDIKTLEIEPAILDSLKPGDMVTVQLRNGGSFTDRIIHEPPSIDVPDNKFIGFEVMTDLTEDCDFGIRRYDGVIQQPFKDLAYSVKLVSTGYGR